MDVCSTAKGTIVMMSPMIIVATLEEGVDNHHCCCRRSSSRMSPLSTLTVVYVSHHHGCRCSCRRQHRPSLQPLRPSTLAIVSAIAIVDVNTGTVTGATIAVVTGVIKTPARTARGVDMGRMRRTITTRATSHRDGRDHESIKDGEGGWRGRE